MGAYEFSLMQMHLRALANSYIITFTCHNLGEKLKKMLKEKGTFKEVECEIARYQKTSLKDTKQGGWVTKHYLQNEKHWTKYISQFFFCWLNAKCPYTFLHEHVCF